MKKVLILGANGQIVKIVTERLIEEQPNVELTLYLKNSEQLSHLKNKHVQIVEGDVNDIEALQKAMLNQDIVFVGFVDHSVDNLLTKNIIAAMKKTGVQRVISSNVLGIYAEVKGEFGRWNKKMISNGLLTAIKSGELYTQSNLDYTTLRLPWLNDRNEIDYTIIRKDEDYLGVSGSRKSMAEVIVNIIKNPDYLINESVGIANENTEGENRPVY